MRRLQYLRRCQQLSIENGAALHVVGPHLRIFRITADSELSDKFISLVDTTAYFTGKPADVIDRNQQ
jgi:hypothetical protein